MLADRTAAAIGAFGAISMNAGRLDRHAVLLDFSLRANKKVAKIAAVKDFSDSKLLAIGMTH